MKPKTRENVLSQDEGAVNEEQVILEFINSGAPYAKVTKEFTARDLNKAASRLTKDMNIRVRAYSVKGIIYLERTRRRRIHRIHRTQNRESTGKSKTRENVLSQDEIDGLLEAVDTRLEDFVVRGLLYTGLRVSELVHVRKDWIDLDRWTLTVPESQPCKCRDCKRVLRNRKGEVIKPARTWKPKTKSGERTIPLVPEVREILEWFFNEHNAVMDVFPYRQYINYTLDDVVDSARIGHPVFPHALRGTFATMMAERGFDIWEIKDTLGWKTIAPAEFYVRIAGERLRRAFEKKWG